MLYHWAISPTCEQSPNHMSKSCKMPPHRIIFHSYTRPLWISRPQCQQRRSWDHCMEAIKLAMATAKPLGSILGCWLFSVQKRDVFWHHLMKFVIFLQSGNHKLLVISKTGLVRELNPGPRAPEARIIPLDQRATNRIKTIDSGGIRTHAPKDWCLKPAP